MSKHRLTLEQQALGLRRAIRRIQRKKVSPKWLLPSMRQYLERLKERIRGGA